MAPASREPRRRALLIVDHGSRRAEANEAVERLASRLRTLRPDLHVEHAHMEIAEPSFAKGVAACVSAGAREIVVQPYFLGDGRHTNETIPALVAEAGARHPEVVIRTTGHLGGHDKLVEIVLERAGEVLDD